MFLFPKRVLNGDERVPLFLIQHLCFWNGMADGSGFKDEKYVCVWESVMNSLTGS